MILKGTTVASKIVPSDSLDNYATHDEEYGVGGHRSVINITQRDAISAEKRKAGMTVYVNDEEKEYRLVGGIENTNWKLEVDSDVVNEATNTALANKVDKEANKQLSEQNYTTAEKNKLANLTDNFKGGYNNATERNAELPNPQDNWYVLQFDTDTFWFYKDNVWTDTASKSTGDMLKSIYDPTGINGDAFSMANMVETLEKKIFTRLEREKLAGIEAGAEKNKVNTVNGKTGTVILTKADFSDLNRVNNTPDNEKIVMEAGRTTGTLSINGQTFNGSVNKTITVEATGSNITFATNAEVATGTASDKAVAPNTIANNYHNKNAVDSMITNLELANTGYNVFEMPKYELNLEILTTERWIDGKPIYRKTINCGALPNNNTKLVDHGITGYEMLRPDLSSCYTAAAGFSFALPRASTTLSGVIDLAITATQVRIITGTAWTGYNNTFVTINYTKLADNTTSPVAKVPIILEGLTELPSPKLGIEVLTASRHPVTGKPIYSKTVDCGFLANTVNGLTITPVNVSTTTDYMQVIAESSCVVIPGVGNFSFGVHMPWYTLASQIGAYIEDGQIVIGVGSPQGNKKAYVTVEYTKASDTALSPAALIGGRGMSLYEHWLSVGNTGTEEQFIDDMKGKITTDILTSEQLAQLNGRLLAFGEYSYKNATAVAHTIGTSKIPVFTTRKTGELIATNASQFTLKANVTYFLDFNIYASPITTELGVSIINDLDSTVILNKDVTTLTMLSSGTYFTPTIDTPISLRIMSHNNTTSGTVTTAIIDSGIKITEYSTVDLKISRLTINGSVVDENNNVDLQGVGNLASPKINAEVLTEYRHPVSSKPIYTKTIAFGALPSSTTKTVSLGIVDTIDALWIDPAFSHGSTFPVPSSYYANSDGYTMTASASGKSVTAKTNGNYSGHSPYVTVRYTKTADTASSPIRLVGGNIIL